MTVVATMIADEEVARLREKARRVRSHIVRMIHSGGAGHPGGSLSAVEIVVLLYEKFLRVDPARPFWDQRDRFILSKGHAAPVLYAVLALKGYFPEAELTTFDHINSRLQGHPDMKKLPGIDMSSGSLGQGLSTGVGMAMAARLKGIDSRIYVLMGDGELQEGQVWEAAMAAAKYKLDNLTAIVDYNGLQLVGPVEDTMSVQPLKAKFEAFGWYVLEADGHDFADLHRALTLCLGLREKPVVIVARTTKGRGVSFMENSVEWHARPITDEELQLALEELGEA